MDGSRLASANSRDSWEVALTKYSKEKNPVLKELFLQELVDYFMAENEAWLVEISLRLTQTDLLSQGTDCLVHLLRDLRREIQAAAAEGVDLRSAVERVCKQWLQSATPGGE